MNKANYVIENEYILEQVDVGGYVHESKKSLINFYRNFSHNEAWFDTGIMPLNGSGVLSIRKALGHTQIVFQHEPGIYPNIWGDRERDKNAKIYHLAQPYRIVIADFHENQLLGCRHFYSLTPGWDANTQLYHVNLPNNNCLGYNGTSVGWICIYPQKHPDAKAVPSMSLAQKIQYATERAGGTEAYNWGNMPSTQGTTFYKKFKPENDFMYNPELWEKKTNEEGFNWILDEKLLLPVRVASKDSQQSHKGNGTYLKLGMAMDGTYHAYYRDPNPLKPFNELGRIDKEEISFEKVLEGFRRAYLNADTFKKVVDVAPKGVKLQLENLQLKNKVPLFHSSLSNKPIYSDDVYLETIDGIVTGEEYVLHYTNCESCNNVYHWANLQVYDDKFYCYNCKQITTCFNCGFLYDNPDNIVDVNYCTNCTKAVNCNSCNVLTSVENTSTIDGLLPNDTKIHHFTLCKMCEPVWKKCEVCKTIRTLDTMMLVYNANRNAQGYGCQDTCIHYNQNDGLWYLNNKTELIPGIVLTN